MSKASTAEPVPSKVLDVVFSALAHPARRRVLIILHARGGEMTAGEINDRFKHSWPTTTRHLGVLENAGIVAVGKRGRHRYYTLERDNLARAGDWLCSWAKPAETGRTGRAKWADLPFATMRNSVPPEDEAGND